MVIQEGFRCGWSEGWLKERSKSETQCRQKEGDMKNTERMQTNVASFQLPLYSHPTYTRTSLSSGARHSLSRSWIWFISSARLKGLSVSQANHRSGAARDDGADGSHERSKLRIVDTIWVWQHHAHKPTKAGFMGLFISIRRKPESDCQGTKLKQIKIAPFPSGLFVYFASVKIKHGQKYRASIPFAREFTSTWLTTVRTMVRSARSLCVATFRRDPPILTASWSFSRCTERFQMQKKNLPYGAEEER